MTFARRRDLRVDKRLGTPHISDASACGTKILLLDERTKGIQPNVMQQIGNALELLRRQGDMAIVLVWQNADFACRIANAFTIMELGRIKNVAAMSAYVQAMLMADFALLKRTTGCRGAGRRPKQFFTSAWITGTNGGVLPIIRDERTALLLMSY